MKKKDVLKRRFIIFICFVIFWVLCCIFPFWSDLHTYYIMDNCTLEQSRKIIELMGIDYYDNIDVTYIEHKTTWGNDIPRHFYLVIYSDNPKIVSDYKAYIDEKTKLNNYENDYEINAVTFSRNKIVIYYTYNMKRDGGPCELELYIKKHGRRTIKLIDK